MAVTSRGEHVRAGDIVAIKSYDNVKCETDADEAEILADLRAAVTAKDAEGTLAAGAPCRAPPSSVPLPPLTHAGPVRR